MFKLALSSHGGQKALVPKFHGKFTQNNRTWILWSLELGEPADSPELKLEGPRECCRLRWTFHNVCLEVNERKMELGTRIWLWNDAPAVPEGVHSTFVINDDGSVSPHAMCPGAKNGSGSDFALGLMGSICCLVGRNDPQRLIFEGAGSVGVGVSSGGGGVNLGSGVTYDPATATASPPNTTAAAWTVHENIDMCFQGDVEIIHDWKSNHSIEDLKRIVEEKSYSAVVVGSFGHAALKTFDYQLKPEHCKPSNGYTCTIYIYDRSAGRGTAGSVGRDKNNSINAGSNQSTNELTPQKIEDLNRRLNDTARNTNDVNALIDLVFQGADLLSTNGHPWHHTPLHQSCFHNRPEMVKKLIELCKEKGIFNEIVKKGSNPCGRGGSGTPVDLAAGGGHNECVDLIEVALGLKESRAHGINAIVPAHLENNNQEIPPRAKLIIHEARYGWATDIWAPTTCSHAAGCKDVTSIVQNDVNTSDNTLSINPNRQPQFMNQHFWPETASGPPIPRKLAIRYSYQTDDATFKTKICELVTEAVPHETVSVNITKTSCDPPSYLQDEPAAASTALTNWNGNALLLLENGEFIGKKWNTPKDAWGQWDYIDLCITDDINMAVTASYDGKFITSTEPGSMVFDVAMWQFTAGNHLVLVKGKRPDCPTRKEGGGRSFSVNTDGTISPTPAKWLVLGKRRNDNTLCLTKRGDPSVCKLKCCLPDFGNAGNINLPTGNANLPIPPPPQRLEESEWDILSAGSKDKRIEEY